MAPKLVLASTHRSVLKLVPLEVLKAHALPGRAETRHDPGPRAGLACTGYEHTGPRDRPRRIIARALARTWLLPMATVADRRIAA